MINKAQNVQGWLTNNEGLELKKLATNGVALEIGSYLGRSAFFMAESANKVVCIDTYRANLDGQDQNDNYTTLFDFLNNTYYVRDRIIPVVATSLEAAKIMQDNNFDVIFIDAMHTYEDVTDDIKAWLPKVKLGGYLCFHDYHTDWPGVIKAVNEYFGKPDYVVDGLAVIKKDLKENVHHPLMIDESKLIENFNDKFSKTSGYVHDGSKPKKRVLISPFSKNLPTRDDNPKNYPYWVELIRLLKENNCFITQLCFGSEKPFQDADNFIFNAPNEKIKQLLNHNDFFICVDTALQHIANYYDKTGVVIWGPSDPLLFGYNTNINILKSRENLRQNQYGNWIVEPTREDIFPTPEEVIETIKHKLI